MNRILKFRAWVKNKIEENIIPYGDKDTFLELSEGDEPDIIKADCIEQYTGLKDKNGKEIYEGDILKIGGQRAVVIFDDEKGCYMGEFKTFWRGHIIQDRDYFHDFKDSREVIGNIHENPELWECMNGRD